jgi:hypothetical protein
MPLRSTLATMFLFAPLAAHASMPATPEQRLCISENNSIVVARVENGAGADCRLSSKLLPCSFTNTVRLSIKIREVIAVGSDDPVYPDRTSDFVKGKVVDVIGRRVSIYAEVSDYTFPPNNDGELIGPTSRALTDDDVRRLYVGKVFIFSISPEFGETPHWTTVWPLKSRKWVSKTLQHPVYGPGCPHPYDPRRTKSPATG